MKKRNLLLSAVFAILFSLSLIGCGNVRLKYNVEFYVDGKMIASMGTTAKKLEIPSAPRKVGYEFDGWYLDEGTWKKPLTVSALEDIPLTDDTVVKVYARYKEKELPLSLNGFTQTDGTFYKTVRNAVTTFDLAAVTDTHGLDWNVYLIETNEKTEKTVALHEGDNLFRIAVRLGEVQRSYAVTVRRRPLYTVTFDTDGGTEIPSQQIEEGERAETDGLTPQKAGYTFVGWAENVTAPVTKPVTFTAVYRGQNYTVHLDANGGTGIPNTVAATFGEDISLPSPQKTGYAFAGWYRDGVLFNDTKYTTAGDTPLTAKYTLASYTITYELRGGQNADGNALSYTMESDDISLAPATRNGAVFEGWYLDAACTRKTEKIASGSTGNKVLYAKWSLISYSVTYHCNGGTLYPDFPYATTYNVESMIDFGPYPTKTDYTFSGWYADEQCSGEKKECILPGSTGDIHLYAKWQYGTQGLGYVDDGNGGYRVTGYGGTATRIVIPGTMDGRPVTQIADYIFEQNTSVTHVEICEGVRSIGTRAFLLSALRSVSIPSTVTEIGDLAFADCIDLQEVYYNAADVADHTRFTQAFGWCFRHASEKERGFDLTVGTAVTRLPAYCMSGASVRTVMFETNGVLSRIGEYAFSGTGENNALALPSTLKTIDKYAFSGTRFNEIGLPDGLKTIGEKAFSGNSYLRELIIPASVSTVGVDILADSPSVIIRVAAQSKGTYWQTNWNASGNIVIYDCFHNDKAENGKAYTFFENVLYSITEEGATLEKLSSATTVVTVPDTIEYNGNSVSVTAIADGVFRGKPIREISLPANLTEIPQNMLYNCEELTTVTFRGNVTSIGESAFQFCAKLTAVNGMDNVTVLGASAFYGCKSLQTVSLPSLAAVGNNAFMQCASLHTIALSPTLTEIGGSAFYGCSALKQFAFPDTLQKIGSTAFRGAGILRADLPDSLTAMGTWVFLESALAEVRIPSTWETIPSMTFSGTQLTRVDIPANIQTIDNSAFGYCYSLQEVTLHEGLTRIADTAFESCGKLQILDLPQSLCSIGSRAFIDCTALNGITFPAALASIGQEAFYNCASLRAVVVRKTIRYIGKDAFKKCPLLSVYTDADWHVSDWSLGADKVFYDCTFSQDGSYVVGIKRNVPSYEFSLQDVVPPAREGYTFGGWFLNPEDDNTQITDLYSLAYGTDIFAKWTEIAPAQ